MARANERVAGCVELEQCGFDGLLRSLAVAFDPRCEESAAVAYQLDAFIRPGECSSGDELALHSFLRPPRKSN
jgi:hypothetical protein